MITFLEKYREPLTKGMSVLTLITFLGFYVLGRVFVDVFNINNTIGWKFSIINTWIDNIPIISFLVFFIIYLLLICFRVKTKLALSAIHLILIGVSSFLFNFLELDLRIYLFLIGCSFIFFGMNLYESLNNKKMLND